MLVKKWKMPLFVFLWNYMNGKQLLYKEKKSVIFIVFFREEMDEASLRMVWDTALSTG